MLITTLQQDGVRCPSMGAAVMISLLDPHQVGPYTVVPVTGEIDVSTAPALRDTALALLNRGTPHLVLDLRGVTFMDSTGLGSLLRIHHRARLLSAKVHVIADQEQLLRLFDTMQLRRHLHVAPTMSAVRECCPVPTPMAVVS